MEKPQQSEEIFENYLRKHDIAFKRAYAVNGANVDFFVQCRGVRLFCDVKEVKVVRPELEGEITAFKNIREDIRRLRQKFRKLSVDIPVVLVTMNFSNQFFTGLTIARAMLGDIGIIFNKNSDATFSPLHHLVKGNAALQERKNTLISGVLGYRFRAKHILFKSPFARHEVPMDVFPETEEISLHKSKSRSHIEQLHKIMFWPILERTS